MSRKFLVLALALALAACGGGSKSPPANPDNACSIAKERPDFIKAFKATERKWGVPVSVQMATIYYESSFRGNAKTPHKFALGIIPMGRQSSAFGYSQALDSTWDQYRDETRRRSAKRDRIKDASDFVGWYMNKTRQKNGVALNDARNRSLAYHEGHGGYARGTHHSKAWLLRTADRVAARAAMYDSQLSGCRRYR